MYKLKKHLLLVGFITTLVSCSTKVKQIENSKAVAKKEIKENNMKNTIYSFEYQTPTDEKKSFDEFKGKVILIVNTATQCGLTPQFEGLEQLHKNFAGEGLKVIGFPCNQFGGQEPTPNAEMVETCKINHGVTFELAKKIEVNGDNENALYTFLKSKQKLEDENDIRWNFEKFLINKEGEVVKRFSPQTTPEEIMAEIEGLL